MTNVVIIAPEKTKVKGGKSKKTPSHFVPSPTIQNDLEDYERDQETMMDMDAALPQMSTRDLRDISKLAILYPPLYNEQGESRMFMGQVRSIVQDNNNSSMLSNKKKSVYDSSRRSPQ